MVGVVIFIELKSIETSSGLYARGRGCVAQPEGERYMHTPQPPAGGSLSRRRSRDDVIVT